MAAKKSPSRLANETQGTSPPLLAKGLWCVPVGLVGLLVWLLGGLLLEGLHGFKVAFYLENDLRRLLWTLAHAHGTLFSALCLIVAMIFPRLIADSRALRRADRLFAIGSVLLPLGFLLGGVVHYETDPNAAIVLVPAGGLCAAAALLIGLRGWMAR